MPTPQTFLPEPPQRNETLDQAKTKLFLLSTTPMAQTQEERKEANKLAAKQYRARKKEEKNKREAKRLRQKGYSDEWYRKNRVRLSQERLQQKNQRELAAMSSNSNTNDNLNPGTDPNENVAANGQQFGSPVVHSDVCSLYLTMSARKDKRTEAARAERRRVFNDRNTFALGLLRGCDTGAMRMFDTIDAEKKDGDESDRAFLESAAQNQPVGLGQVPDVDTAEKGLDAVQHRLFSAHATSSSPSVAGISHQAASSSPLAASINHQVASSHLRASLPDALVDNRKTVPVTAPVDNRKQPPPDTSFTHIQPDPSLAIDLEQDSEKKAPADHDPVEYSFYEPQDELMMTTTTTILTTSGHDPPGGDPPGQELASLLPGILESKVFTAAPESILADATASRIASPHSYTAGVDSKPNNGFESATTVTSKSASSVPATAHSITVGVENSSTNNKGTPTSFFPRPAATSSFAVDGTNSSTNNHGTSAPPFLGQSGTPSNTIGVTNSSTTNNGTLASAFPGLSGETGIQGASLMPVATCGRFSLGAMTSSTPKKGKKRTSRQGRLSSTPQQVHRERRQDNSIRSDRSKDRSMDRSMDRSKHARREQLFKDNRDLREL